MSYQQPYPPQYPPPTGGQNPYGTIVCPFCGGTTNQQVCNWCGRDTTAPRRPCPKCRRMATTYEPACWNCGAKFTNEMGWKIPLIILIFVLATILSVVIRLAMR
jgi:hypothetical protein